MFKLALNAGHYLGTPGKRCLKSIDPKETREWVLNDRICDKIEKLLAGYNGISVLRIDDTSGVEDRSLIARTSKANRWGANFYLAIHHNAGVKGGKGGGIVAYTYTKVNDVTKEWQKELYNAIIAATGLKGNRSKPLNSANLHECRETKMPAVLLECGFMDSKTDTPIILTEEFADKVAGAIVDVIAKRGNLTQKEEKPSVNPDKKEKTNDILEWQLAAKRDGYKFPKYGADGKWGTECETVAKKAIVKKRLIYTNKNLTKIVQRVVGVTVDGKCGKDTEAAIKAWQKAHGLTSDGVVGLNTWKAMLNV